MDQQFTDYKLITAHFAALVAGEADPLANSANFVGLIFTSLTDINWAGLYVLRGDQLVLGPYQGNPACVRIPLGHGVCGTAAKSGESQRVADVHAFDGHIACDPASNSEIVVPLRIGGELVGVFDIDSPSHARFDEADQEGIENLCRAFERCLAENGGDFL